MQQLHGERPMRSHVMAMFEASPLSFRRPRAATLEYLAIRLACLAERQAVR